MKYSKIARGRRVTKQITESDKGWSVMLKEESLLPRRTLYVYHLFINRDYAVSHSHFKYRIGRAGAKWLKYTQQRKLSREEFEELVVPP